MLSRRHGAKWPDKATWGGWIVLGRLMLAASRLHLVLSLLIFVGSNARFRPLCRDMILAFAKATRFLREPLQLLTTTTILLLRSSVTAGLKMGEHRSP